MAKTISVSDARANFSAVLGEVHHTGIPTIIERNGKPYAVVISPAAWRRLLDHDWEVIDRIRERNADKDPDEVYAQVTAAVEEVRRERREQREREDAAAERG
jgi:prevent-host-death family protein